MKADIPLNKETKPNQTKPNLITDKSLFISILYLKDFIEYYPICYEFYNKIIYNIFLW